HFRKRLDNIIRPNPPSEDANKTAELVKKVPKVPISRPGPPGEREGLSPTGDQQTLVTQSPVAHQSPVSSSHPYTEPERNYTKVPNVVLDKLESLLDPYEFKVYMRLFRLSHGFRTNQCTVGYHALAQGCSLSIRHIKRVVPQLIARGLVEILEVHNT